MRRRDFLRICKGYIAGTVFALGTGGMISISHAGNNPEDTNKDIPLEAIVENVLMKNNYPQILAIGELHRASNIDIKDSTDYLADIVPILKNHNYRDSVFEFIPIDTPIDELEYINTAGKIDQNTPFLLGLPLIKNYENGHKSVNKLLKALVDNNIRAHRGGSIHNIPLREALKYEKFAKDDFKDFAYLTLYRFF